MAVHTDSWPELRYERYRETRDLLHMQAQIVGKLRLALTPPLAQWAHAPLRLSADGLATGPLWVGDGVLSVDLDLVRHEARFKRSDGRRGAVELGLGTVAEFFSSVRDVLDELEVDVAINPMPQEVAEPVAFDRDTRQRAYDRDASQRALPRHDPGRLRLRAGAERLLGQAVAGQLLLGRLRPAPSHGTRDGRCRLPKACRRS